MHGAIQLGQEAGRIDLAREARIKGRAAQAWIPGNKGQAKRLGYAGGEANKKGGQETLLGQEDWAMRRS